MKVLVFGGAGFLGSYVVDELITRGHDVSIFDIKPSPYVNGKATMIVGDIMDADAVRAAIQGQDAVYNFAGLADLNDSIDKPVETVTLNVIGNLNILDAARHAGVKRYMYASSVYVFSQKGAFYGASKKSSELIVEQYGEQYDIDYTIVRYGSVYGERADANNRIYRIIREALTAKKISFQGDGSEEREYVHGRDAAKLSVDVLEDDKYRNQNVILTGIERFQYSELLSFVKEMLNDEVSIEMLDQDYKGHYVLTPVRRHSNWNNQRPDLKEDLAHLVQYIKRRICGIASAGSPLSSV
ncbi:MAG: NAD(P)-dependent oxidoreductase [Rhodospirillaceae bacterium]|nr:NAD(P)-dependent oxidoreductase [Rhodospirillaceae bacterium]